MGTENTKSGVVTIADNLNGAKKNSPLVYGGMLHQQVGKVEVAAADDNNSIYRMGRVHSSWRPMHMWLFNDAIQSGADYNLGLWDIAEAGGAVISENCFGDAVSMTSARAASGGTDIMHEALNIDDATKAYWEIAGLTTDPNKWMDVCFIGIAVGSGAGGIVLKTVSVLPNG
jgi:hypothetical protein